MIQPIISTSLVLGTLALLFRKRNEPVAIAAVLAAYVSLHFAYSGVGILPDSLDERLAGRMVGNAYAKIGGIVVLIAALLLLVPFWKRERCLKSTNRAAILCCALVIGGYAIFWGRSATPAGLWLQDGLSTLAFFVFSPMLAAILLAVPQGDPWGTGRRALPFLAIFIIFCSLFGFYEVASGKSWALYRSQDGEFVRRASSFFFNPNWFGAWSALAGFAVLFLAEDSRANKGTIGISGFFLGAGFFISGSRGALISFAVLAIVLLVLKRADDRRRLYGPLACTCAGFALPLTFAPIVFGSHSPCAALAHRWQSLPMELAIFFDTHLGHGRLFGADAAPSRIQQNSWEFLSSMNERFSSVLRDNGFLALYDDASWLGVSAMALWMAVWAIHLVRAWSGRARSPLYPYAVVLFLFLVCWAMQARSFQVFPMWLAGALLFAVSTAIIHRVPDGRR